jgi:hypothetical protein
VVIMTNVIEAAVNPMKAEAMNRAEKEARAIIARVAADLEKAGNDLQICAPYPEFADMSAEKGEKFVQEARENAAFQYEAYVAKLNKKIGPAKSASLTGNHVWGYSFLTVVTESGETQIWKTQMIVNVSKLGKLFNQFPTRKVKAAN